MKSVSVRELSRLIEGVENLELMSPRHKEILAAGRRFEEEVFSLFEEIKRRTPQRKFICRCCWTAESAAGELIDLSTGEVEVSVERPFVFMGKGYLTKGDLAEDLKLNADRFAKEIFTWDWRMTPKVSQLRELGLKETLVRNISDEVLAEMVPQPASPKFWRVSGDGEIGGETVTGFWTASPENALNILNYIYQKADEYGYCISPRILFCESGNHNPRLQLLHKAAHNPAFDDNEVFFDIVRDWKEISLKELKEEIRKEVVA